MTLSKLERLMLHNQYKILEHLDPDNADHYVKMQEVLENGYELEYGPKTEHIRELGMSEEACTFVIKVMSMYDAIQRSYSTVGDQTGISEDATVFAGFDGNNEAEYLAYVRFLMERDDKFTYLKVGGDNLNSHSPTLEMYRRMKTEWEQLDEKYDLSSDELRRVVNARFHPNMRAS